MLSFAPHWQSHVAPLAAVLVAATALLALRRMPAGASSRPAIRPALALSAAWLFFWPYQFAWYDVMIICLLLFYPASRLDWLVLARLTAGTIPTIPGNPPTIMLARTSHLVIGFHNAAVYALVPLVLLGAAAGLVALCLSGRWNLGGPSGPPGAPPPGTARVAGPGSAAPADRVGAADRA